MTDRDTGKSRGFAFVEMAQDDDAEKAIAALNGKDLGGRSLTINEARPRPERSGGFRSGGGDGGKRRGGRNSSRGARSSRDPRW
jgi:RNA recognition motif-containing protein